MLSSTQITVHRAQSTSRSKSHWQFYLTLPQTTIVLGEPDFSLITTSNTIDNQSIVHTKKLLLTQLEIDISTFNNIRAKIQKERVSTLFVYYVFWSLALASFLMSIAHRLGSGSWSIAQKAASLGRSSRLVLCRQQLHGV
jgi:hypothetical protein